MIENGAGNVVIDMTDTTFIDSTTLGVLVSGLKRLNPSGGKLTLVVTDRNIRKIFEITGLDRVFTIHEKRSAAVDELEQNGRLARQRRRRKVSICRDQEIRTEWTQKAA